MSFMPNTGTVCRMNDGRVAAVSAIDPQGEHDRMIYEDGHEEPTDAWQIAELLTDEHPIGRDPLTELHAYLKGKGEREQESS